MEIMYGPTAIPNGPAHLAQSENPCQPTKPLLTLLTSIQRTADNLRKHASSDTTLSPVAAAYILLFQAWTLGRGSLPPARAWARVLAVSVRLIPFFLASLGLRASITLAAKHMEAAKPKPARHASPRPESAQLVASLADKPVARFRHLVPGPGEVDNRFRDDNPCLVGHLLQA
jgi:hypothetical protein